jgi:hypothetical protein
MAGSDEGFMQEILRPPPQYELQHDQPDQDHDLQYLEADGGGKLDFYGGGGHDDNLRTVEFFQAVKNFYADGLFCDLRLVAGCVDVGFNSVPCHSLVIVSAIPAFIKILDDSSSSCDMEDNKIHLPEFSFNEVKSLVDGIYAALDVNCRSEVFIYNELAKSLGLKDDNGDSIVNMPSSVEVFKALKPVFNAVIEIKPIQVQVQVQVKSEDVKLVVDDQEDLPLSAVSRSTRSSTIAGTSHFLNEF